jgi:hypothetical protein
MPETNPQRISVDVDSGDGNLVKIKWRRELPWGLAYSVPRGMLEEKSANARERLEALVGEALTGNVKQTGAILKEVAQAGHRLYNSLFYDPNGPGQATRMKGRMRELMHARIDFSMGVPLHVPWGLVYDGDPERLSGHAGDIDFANYRDFWCIKYQVASVYHTVDPEGANKPLPGDVLGVHAIMNQAVYDRTGPHLLACGGPYWQGITARFGPPVFSQKAWLARWEKEYDTTAVLYFYSHANGGNIGLGADNISANDLAQDLAARSGGTLPCLVFINGCSTAVGDPKGGFLEATSGSRFCGFIGAEASIPDVYALRFGSAFLYEFLRGKKSVIEIMRDLRQQHWPLSLLYNAYCVPDLRIAPAPPLLPPVVVNNFCDFDLGTQGI